MRYEIYELSPDGQTCTFLDEDSDGDAAYAKVSAYEERAEGRLLVIDNLTPPDKACRPQHKSPLSDYEKYTLLMECKMIRLLELERRKDAEALIENFSEKYDELKLQAMTEVDGLLGMETMARLMCGGKGSGKRR